MIYGGIFKRTDVNIAEDATLLCSLLAAGKLEELANVIYANVTCDGGFCVDGLGLSFHFPTIVCVSIITATSNVYSNFQVRNTCVM